AAPPQPFLRLELTEQLKGGAGDVVVDLQIWRGLAGRRDETGGDPTEQCEHQHQAGGGGRIAVVADDVAADDGAEEDPKEGTALNEGFACRQFMFREMVWQDPVFDWGKQRS